MQVFNLVYYGVVDKLLLNVYLGNADLACRMDMNDFIHVNLPYLLRRSAGLVHLSALTAALPVPPGVPLLTAPSSQTRECTRREASTSLVPYRPSPVSEESDDLDIIPSTQDDAVSVDHIDQYGSHLSRGAQQFDYFCEDVWGHEEQPSPRINPLLTASSPSSPLATSPTRGDAGIDHANVGMASQPEVSSSHVDDIRVPVEHTPPSPGSDGTKDVEADAVLEIGSHAHGASAPIDIVNVSNLESDDGKYLIGDSSDESDHDNEGVDQGISVLAPPMATIAPSMDSSQSPTVLPMTGESAMQQFQNSAEPIEGNTFRNAAGKAPHPDAIVLKVESGWWAKRELKKKLKAE